MKKNDILAPLTVEKLIFGGSGLSTAPDGRRVILSGGAIPESVVEARIVRVRKNHIEAQITRTLKTSPLEQPIPAEWQLYGGCRWLPIPYHKQLEIKADQVREAFHTLEGALQDTTFHPIVPAPLTEHYRNKVEFSWGKYISARIEDCRYCVLADDEVNALFRDIDQLARMSGLPTYDPKRQEGFWRHLVVRKAQKSQEIMLIFSVNGVYSGKIRDFFTVMVQQLSEKYKNLVSLYFLENTGKADIVQGDLTLLFGKSSITEELLGKQFEIQPKSFFQVNTLAAEKLYTQAIDLIRQRGGILLDLYAGTGTIGILLAEHFEHVYSVELIASASEDGKKNALKNHVENITFVQAKVEDFLADIARENTADTIIVDPPRDGLHPKAVEHIKHFGAREIIYVSCNPATLVRDLEILLTDNATQTDTAKKITYRITDVVGVDMFPHTHHIETVVRLERVNVE